LIGLGGLSHVLSKPDRPGMPGDASRRGYRPMKSPFSKFLFLLVVLLLSPVAGCGHGGPEILKRTQFLMGTLVEITVIARNDQASADALSGAFEVMRRIERLMSRRIEGSDVWRVNRAAGRKAVKISGDVLCVMEKALQVSDLSGGAFDPTVGSLVSLWDRCWKGDRVPSRGEVASALARVGYRDLQIDEDKGALFLRREGMELALGGIAKGYAVDRAFRFLKDLGFKALIVDAGGDLRTGGTKFGAPWVVGIQDPRDESRLMATVEVKEAAVATSGDYERYFIKDGVRYHHILDPVTGFPARRSRSVTVFSDRLVWADALATAVFVLGPERGMALVESLPGTEALIVDGEGRVSISSGMGGRIRFQ